MYYCCGITEKGIMPHNEDALLIGRHVMTAGMVEQNLKPPFIMAVSDGVSGENAGELASVMCLEGLRDIADFRKSQLHGEIMEIHEKLAEYSRNDEESRNMQTTLCGIAVDENQRIFAFNVGARSSVTTMTAWTPSPRKSLSTSIRNSRRRLATAAQNTPSRSSPSPPM